MAGMNPHRDSWVYFLTFLAVCALLVGSLYLHLKTIDGSFPSRLGVFLAVISGLVAVGMAIVRPSLTIGPIFAFQMGIMGCAVVAIVVLLILGIIVAALSYLITGTPDTSGTPATPVTSPSPRRFPEFNVDGRDKPITVRVGHRVSLTWYAWGTTEPTPCHAKSAVYTPPPGEGSKYATRAADALRIWAGPKPASGTNMIFIPAPGRYTFWLSCRPQESAPIQESNAIVEAIP